MVGHTFVRVLGAGLAVLTVAAARVQGGPVQSIVFVSDRTGDKEIWRMDSDGTGLVQLTFNPGVDAEPVPSPDGEWIAYVSGAGNPPSGPGECAETDIWIMRADGREARRLTFYETAYTHQPAWSPDGLKLAFVRECDGRHLGEVPVDLSEPACDLASGVARYDLEYHSTGTHLLYTRDNSGAGWWDIWRMEIGPGPCDNRGEERLTSWSHSLGGAYSHDGNRIAYIRAHRSVSQVRVMNSHGAGNTPLWDNSAIAYDGWGQATWSPEGGKVAVSVYPSRYPGVPEFDSFVQVLDALTGDEIYRVSDGRNTFAFESGYYRDRHFVAANMVWSSDGTKLVFMSDRDGNWQIYTMNPDGTEQVNLTNSSAWDGDAAWFSAAGLIGEGACCVDSVCSATTQGTCEADGGVYQGDGTLCSEIECPGEPVTINVSVTGEVGDFARDLLVSWEGAPGSTLDSVTINGHDVTPYIEFASENIAYVPAILFWDSSTISVEVGLWVGPELVEAARELDVQVVLSQYTEWASRMPWDFMATILEEEWPDDLTEPLRFLDYAVFLNDSWTAIGDEDWVSLYDAVFGQALSALYGGPAYFVLDLGAEFMILRPNRDMFTEEEYEALMEQGILGMTALVFTYGVADLHEYIALGWAPDGSWHSPGLYLPPIIGAPYRNIEEDLVALAGTYSELEDQINDWLDQLLQIILHSPASIEIVDPIGRTFSSGSSSIPFTFFRAIDESLPDDPVEHFYIYEPEPGMYQVFVSPDPDAQADEMVTLNAKLYGEQIVLLDHVPVADLPTAPLLIEVSEPGEPIPTIHVDDDAPLGGDGTTWSTAYKYLQDALAVATGGDEVHVAGGTYKPDMDEGGNATPCDRSATFQLISGVTLYGGYAGLGDAGNPDQRDIEVYETVLSGDLEGDDGPDFQNNDDNSYHVVIGSGTDNTGILEGFTITGGNADGSYPNERGGGMYSQGGTPTVTHCTFIGNTATCCGGGIWGGGGTLVITGCTITGNMANDGGGLAECDGPISHSEITDNEAWTHGGGLFACDGTIEHCTIADNRADWGGGLRDCDGPIEYCRITGNRSGNNGGGLDESDGPISNCTVAGNHAGGWGGGFARCDGPISNCTITANTAGGNGGGLAECNGAITHCEIRDNVADYDGGGLAYCGDRIDSCKIVGNHAGRSGGGLHHCGAGITHCTIAENSAGINGGGLDACSGTIEGCTITGNVAGNVGGGLNFCHGTINNCLIAGNRANRGGGLDECDGIINNCTITENWALSSGGGLSWCNWIISNCIIRGNIQGNPPVPNQVENSAPPVYSCIDDCDPEFVVPGSWSPIPPYPWAEGDYHLSPASPCIDAGNNTLVPSDTLDLNDDGDASEPTPLDLGGNSRFVDDCLMDDTGLGDPAVVDMGAYEYQRNDMDDDGDVDLRDFAGFQRCFTGPEPDDPGAVVPGCEDFDADCDDDVDIDDFAMFHFTVAHP